MTRLARQRHLLRYVFVSTLVTAFVAASIPARAAEPSKTDTIWVTPEKPTTVPTASSEATDLPAGIDCQLNLSYLTPGSDAQRLDLYVPRGPGPYPLVLWIHGGAWMLGSKSIWAHMMFLLDHGFAVANVEYRFSQQAHFPAQLDDCQAALDFLVAHAAADRLDSTRIAATGESAGGHLASLLGMTRSAKASGPGAAAGTAGSVRAVIDLFGPTDLPAIEASSPQLVAVVSQLLGGSTAQQHQLAEQASPLAQVRADDPPFLILQGTADTIVPLSQSERLADALHAAGVPVQLIMVRGAGHAVAEFWVPSMHERMLTFLKSTLDVH